MSIWECGLGHKYQVIRTEMSPVDPPKAWYYCRCSECGKMIDGHSEDLYKRVDEIYNGADEDVPCVSDVKRAYLDGFLDDYEFEVKLEEVMGLR